MTPSKREKFIKNVDSPGIYSGNRHEYDSKIEYAVKHPQPGEPPFDDRVKPISYPAQPGGQWVYVSVIILNETAWKLYINGEYVNASSWSPYTTAKGARIGDGYKGFLNTTIDELRIWNRSLTDEEIRQHYQSNLKKYRQNEMFIFDNNLLA